ncbi:hypothetical protein Ahy_A04g021448 isoform C [Arachis hypogaea]|nr:hypothetical protein Ahy_A04g021448 isoform C [Arachis hypogaea]
MDFSNVVTQEDGPEVDGDLAQLTSSSEGNSPKTMPPIWSEVMRFFTNPHKPMILALSRPDPKKNIITLLKAFGESRPLRELANLTLIMGNRDDIDEMSSGNASVLTTVLKIIDKYDLYGQVAYPKHHKQADVPEIYRFAAKTRAAAHGLPMVATKNGGPVDIHRALNNGLLVDPHDQQAIANALLKLLSDKSMWQECRKNGLKNIHLFSWPEHCRTYLTRVAACRMRHPQWQTSTPGDDIPAEESFNDSLKDVQDMSLRLSIDGDLAGFSGGHDMQDQVKRVLMSRMKKLDHGSNDNDGGNKLQDNAVGKYPLLRRRRMLIVIALDSYKSTGLPDKNMIKIVQSIMKAAQLDPHNAKISGFVLSTAMPMSEAVDFLKSGNIRAKDFDALICSSGSEVYYPCTPTEDGKLVPDMDYCAHIDYRWGYEGLKNTISKLMNTSEVEGKKSSSSPIVEELKSSNSHCISYKIKDPSKVRKVDDLRQKLRMRGLRCHPMYCRRSTCMQVVPLLASRAQALSQGSYHREDVVQDGSPNVAEINEATENNIASALKQLSQAGPM